MKRMAHIVSAIILVVLMYGCASWGQRGGSPTEIHPGHVGHEIHD